VPFTFDLPELAGSPFSLVGGRVTYLHQQPAAHLVFRFQQHLISAFIFRDSPQAAFEPARASASSFNMRTWTRGPLRYVLVGDASANTLQQLSDLLNTPQ
jgi:anti-sigma factor RsiW